MHIFLHITKKWSVPDATPLYLKFFLKTFLQENIFLIERCLKVAEKGKLFTELSGKETFSTALSSHPLIFGLQEDFLNHVFWLPPRARLPNHSWSPLGSRVVKLEFIFHLKTGSTHSFLTKYNSRNNEVYCASWERNTKPPINLKSIKLEFI